MKLIYPDWEAPSFIRAFSTTKGVDLDSQDFLKKVLKLPSDPRWLNQNHGVQLLLDTSHEIESDGAVTFKKNRVLVVRTADCLPIFLTDVKGTFVSILHAGWRGLSSGIIVEAMKHISVSIADILVHLGPCISGESYEVGQDVYNSFIQTDRLFREGFRSIGQGKYYLDLQQCATIQLKSLGIQNVTKYKGCTFKEEDKFHSYRRNKQVGRMGHFIYIS